LLAGYFLLHEDLSLAGSLVGLVTMAALLTAVVTCGVTVSAMVNSTVVGVAVLWVVLYGGGFVLAMLPDKLLSPDRVLSRLPHILRVAYNLNDLGELSGWALGASCIFAAAGLVVLTHRDA